MQQNITPRSKKGARRVNRFARLEKLRRAVAQNVAQNAAEGCRNDADQRGGQNRSSDSERIPTPDAVNKPKPSASITIKALRLEKSLLKRSRSRATADSAKM